MAASVLVEAEGINPATFNVMVTTARGVALSLAVAIVIGTVVPTPALRERKRCTYAFGEASGRNARMSLSKTSLDNIECYRQ